MNNDNPPSRLRRFFDYVDPRVKHVGLQYVHFVATTSLGLVSGLILAFLFAFGVFTAGHAALSWAQQIQQARTAAHIQGGVKIDPKRVFIAPSTGGAPLKSSGGIFFRYFGGTTNQGWTLSCASQGFSKLLGYEESRALATTGSLKSRTYWRHHPVRISARQLYDRMTGGANRYSSISDYNELASSYGTVSPAVLSYGPHQHPSWISQWGTEPVPSFANFGTIRISHPSYLWKYQGAGYAAVQRAREVLAHHRPLSINSDWYFNAEKSSWTTGKMGLPVQGDWVEYGHTVVLVRYNDRIRMPDGTTGAFLASNSAGVLYGRDKFGNIHRGHGGYVWISYAYVERYASVGIVEDLGYAPTGGSSNPKDRPATNPNAPTFRSPIDPGPQTGGAYSPYVHGVVLHDTGYDITNLINAQVDRFHIRGVYEVSGPAIVAIGITESSLRQYAPRCCTPGDTSYGPFQFTLGTACAYGICSNIEANLNNPVISTRLVAEYVDNIYHSHPAVGWPNSYVFFNAGNGVSDNFAWNPTGVAYSNLLNFDVNWNVATRYYMGGSLGVVAGPTYAHQVFRIKQWCRSYRAWKLPGCPSAYWHGKLGLVPRFWSFTKGVSARVGGVGAPEVWHPRQRYMSQRFQHRYSIISWPTHPGWQPAIKRG